MLDCVWFTVRKWKKGAAFHCGKHRCDDVLFGKSCHCTCLHSISCSETMLQVRGTIGRRSSVFLGPSQVISPDVKKAKRKKKRLEKKVGTGVKVRLCWNDDAMHTALQIRFWIQHEPNGDTHNTQTMQGTLLFSCSRQTSVHPFSDAHCRFVAPLRGTWPSISQHTVATHRLLRAFGYVDILNAPL